MRQFLRRHVMLDGRRESAGVPPEAGWRRVPNVNLLPDPAAPAAGIAMLGLLALVLAELLVVGLAYRSLRDAREGASALETRLARAQSDLTREESGLQAAYAEIDKLGNPDDGLPATTGPPAPEGSLDWALALGALFGAEVPGVSFESVVASSGGTADIVGTATDVAAMARFQAHVGTVSDFLSLLSLRWDEKASSLGFTASVRLQSP